MNFFLHTHVHMPKKAQAGTLFGIFCHKKTRQKFTASVNVPDSK